MAGESYLQLGQHTACEEQTGGVASAVVCEADLKGVACDRQRVKNWRTNSRSEFGSAIAQKFRATLSVAHASVCASGYLNAEAREFLGVGGFHDVVALDGRPDDLYKKLRAYALHPASTAGPRLHTPNDNACLHTACAVLLRCYPFHSAALPPLYVPPTTYNHKCAQAEATER